MTGFLRSPILWAVLLFPSLVLAEEPQLRWTPVPGAGGYLIEIRTRAEKAIVAETVTQASFVLNLAPGDYEARITTLNKFLRPETGSAWTPFSVRRAIVPTLAEVIPGVLEEGQPQRFVVRGTGLSSSTEVQLFAGADEVKVSAIRVLSTQEIEFSVAVPLKPGSYSLVLRNPPGLRAQLPGGLTVVPLPQPLALAPRPQPLPKPVSAPVPELLPTAPEPVPPALILPTAPVNLHFSVGGGYGVWLPLKPWGDLVGPSYQNAEAFALVPWMGKLGPLVQIEYVGFESPKATEFVTSRLNAEGLSVGGFLELESPLPLRFWVAPGVSFTQAVVGGETASSVDPSLVAGASVVFRATDTLFWEVGSQYQVYFYTGTPLQNLGVTVRTGLDF